MEMMHHEAGVKTVVAGGRPEYGPMQAPAQSRGARMYEVSVMDQDIALIQDIDNTTYNVLPNRTTSNDVYITFASVNLRDQMRKDGDVPVQFLYEAADCRIFYTFQTWYNYTALWQNAADAIWTKPQLCVKGSTGYSTDPHNPAAAAPPPSAAAAAASIHPNITGIVTLTGNARQFPGVHAVEPGDPDAPIPDASRFAGLDGKPCRVRCGGSFICHAVPACDDEGKLVERRECVPPCSSIQPFCAGARRCQFFGRPKLDPLLHERFRQGACVPRKTPLCGADGHEGIKLPPPDSSVD
jgi:hypothetical protein